MSIELAAPPHHQASRQPEILADIVQEGVNLCMWQRSPLETWSSAIQALLHAPRRIALDLHAPTTEQITDSLGALIERDPDTKASIAALARDVHDLSRRFATIAEVRHPRVRLTRIEDEGCALFHADTLVLRMLCTYAGPGMQWLENDNVRREELGSHGRTLEEATKAIVIDPDRIQTVPEACVSIFKGRRFEGEEQNALVHRSSPLRHPDDYRFRLCIDLPTACAC